MREVNDYT